MMLRTTARRSPFVDVNTAAVRSIKAAGGSSLTNRIASSFAMCRADVEHALPIVNTAAAADGMAQDDLLVSIVPAGRKDKPRTLTRPHRPTRKRARDVDDILLRVAAV